MLGFLFVFAFPALLSVAHGFPLKPFEPYVMPPISPDQFAFGPPYSQSAPIESFLPSPQFGGPSAFDPYQSQYLYQQNPLDLSNYAANFNKLKPVEGGIKVCKYGADEPGYGGCLSKVFKK